MCHILKTLSGIPALKNVQCHHISMLLGNRRYFRVAIVTFDNDIKTLFTSILSLTKTLELELLL